MEGEDKAEEVTDIESCLQQDMTPGRGHGYWQSAAASLSLSSLHFTKLVDFQ